jgi:hypothetical protein
MLPLTSHYHALDRTRIRLDTYVVHSLVGPAGPDTNLNPRLASVHVSRTAQSLLGLAAEAHVCAAGWDCRRLPPFSAFTQAVGHAFPVDPSSAPITAPTFRCAHWLGITTAPPRPVTLCTVAGGAFLNNQLPRKTVTPPNPSARSRLRLLFVLEGRGQRKTPLRPSHSWRPSPTTISCAPPASDTCF